MKNFMGILCLMAVFAVLTVQAAPQRVRGEATSSTTETAPTARTRGQRRSTTRVPGNPNNDLIRKGLIDRLCTRKYGKGATSTSTTQSTSTTTGSPSDSALSTSSSTTAPTRRSRSRSRSARATRVTSSTTAPTTFVPSCSDFDDLSFEQLMMRNKAGLRPVRRRESTLKSIE